MEFGLIEEKSYCLYPSMIHSQLIDPTEIYTASPRVRIEGFRLYDADDNR